MGDINMILWNELKKHRGHKVVLCHMEIGTILQIYA